MATIDRIIQSMRSGGCRHVHIENDQEVAGQCLEGQAAIDLDRLTRTELDELVREVMPVQHHDAYSAGDGVQFEYSPPDGGESAVVSVNRLGDRIRLGINLNPSGILGDGEAGSQAEPDQSETERAAAHSSGSDGGRRSAPSPREETNGREENPLHPVVSGTRERGSFASDEAPSRPRLLRSNASFPRMMPRSLGWSENRIRLTGAIAGLVFGLGTALLAYWLPSEGSLLRRMFDPTNLMTAIPVSISCLFFWALTICCLRWLRLRALERVSKTGLLLDATRLLAATGPDYVAEELENEAVASSPLLRRLQAVVRQWLIRPGLNDADLVLQQHVATDENEVHSGYSLVRMFVWALPVLGLIGTVIGISLAVGGFAHFLGGDIEVVSIVKQNLVEVTGGLSFAFLITLQGLLTSLLVMLPASVLQTREEKLYSTIQQKICDIFLPTLQRVSPDIQESRDSETGSLRETLGEVAEEVLNATREHVAQVLVLMSERERDRRGEFSQWTQAWRQNLEDIVNKVSHQIDRIGEGLDHARDGHLDRLAQLQEVIGQHTLDLRAVGDEQLAALSERHREMMTTMAEQTEAVRLTGQALTGLMDLSRDTMERGSALREAVGQWHDDRTEYLETVQSLADALGRLGATTKTALETQAALQNAMTQLRETGLERTLASFRDSLVSLHPFLTALSGPLIFQAVPANRSQRNEE